MREKKAHTWDRDALNWYVEPVWVSQRLFREVDMPGTVLDPCAGMGQVVTGGALSGVEVIARDIADRGFNVGGAHDFFDAEDWRARPVAADHIVSNPPYGVRDRAAIPPHRKRWEEEFVRLALERATTLVCVFLRSGWAHGKERGTWLETMPLWRIYSLGPRPSCPPGSALVNGTAAGSGQIDYSWFVFRKGYSGYPEFRWLRRDD